MAQEASRESSKYAEGMHRLAEQWPYLRYLGMGAWWAWIWLCYSGTGLFALWPSGPWAPHVGTMYLYSTPAIACALIAAAFAWRQATGLLLRRAFVVGCSCLGVLGSALIAVAPLLGGSPCFVLGGLLTGLGTSVLALETGMVFGTLGRREVLTAGSIALVFAAFLYFMGTGLPTPWQPAFIAAMPLLSALLFSMPGEDPFPADQPNLHEPGAHAPGMRSYIRLVVASALVAATAGFARGMAATSLNNGAYVESGAVIAFVICAASIAICVMVNSGDIVRAVRRVYTALIFLGVALALASVFGLNPVYLGIGKELLWMIFTCIMAYMAFRFGFSPVRAFGFGQAAYLVASACAWGAGMACAPLLHNPAAATGIAAALVLVIVVVFSFVFTDADIKFIFTWHRETTGAPCDTATATGSPDPQGPDAPGTPTAGVSLERRIAAIPERFGVSSREAQIMLLFAQGHSANWIAEDLVISKNTVRSHIRSIYTKLDVHSRRELLDFLATVGA